MNTNFKVIGLTRLGIKSTSTAPEADALTTRTFELSNQQSFNVKYFKLNLAHHHSSVLFLVLEITDNKLDLTSATIAHFNEKVLLFQLKSILQLLNNDRNKYIL